MKATPDNNKYVDCLYNTHAHSKRRVRERQRHRDPETERERERSIDFVFDKITKKFSRFLCLH